jgi:SPP1 gp7 family putative phage head morphogenesis protein
MNVSDQFASELMSHAVNLGRFESHEAAKLLQIFEALEAELIRQLRWHDPTEPTLTVYQRQRAEKLLAHVRSVIGDYYRQMHRTLRVDLRELATTEATLTQALGAEIVVDTLFSVGVPETTLKAMVNDLILEGRPLKDWWSRQATGTLDRYAAVIRQGLVRGDSVNDMVRVLQGTRERRFQDGVFQRSKTDVQTLVRTSVQSVANESRIETFRQNSDVLRGMEWLTGADSAVCPICRPLSGQTWNLDGRKLPGTRLAFPGAPPRH